MPIDDHGDTLTRIQSQLPNTFRDSARVLLMQYNHLAPEQKAQALSAMALGLSLTKDLTPQSNAAIAARFTQETTPMTKDQTTTRDRLNKVIEDHLGIPEAGRYADDASFMDDLGCDSLDAVEIIMEVEEQWGIEITEDEAGDITTIKDMISLIEKKTHGV